MLKRFSRWLALLICPSLKDLDTSLKARTACVKAYKDLLSQSEKEFVRSCSILHDAVNEGINHSIENRKLREENESLKTNLRTREMLESI